MSFLKKIFQSAYDELWKAVIRPNRDRYSDIELGPEKFEIKQKCFKRTDFTLRNKKNYKLVCSYWEPFDEEREYPKLPCVIYLHGNSSSRCEVVPEIKYLLKKGITVFAFDFSGCGKSEGEYISLGWHEQDDVSCVVDFLRRSNKVSSIGIWGRSMGAATALMYSAKDLSIAGLVLDSPFSSLKNLINELAKERVALPEFVVRQAIKWIKETIKEKAEFNLDDVEPINYAEKCFIPAFFCHSKQDTFVNIHHCKDLYNLYAGDKSIVYVKGNHNSERSIHFKESVAQFFYKALRCQEMEQQHAFNSLTNIEFHYDDKYDLLESIEDELLETVRSINSDMHKYAISDTDTSIPLWIETASYIYDKRDFFRPLILIPGDPRFVHKWNKVIRNTIQLRLAADNLDCSSMDMELVTYSMASSMIGMYEYWFQYRPDLTPKQIAESGSKLLWSAFYKLQDPS